MKIFISSDMEATNGVCVWEETERDKRMYLYFAAKMSDEVSAVCRGINSFNEDVYIEVKDAHGSGRNMDHQRFPKNVSLRRGLSGSPKYMMEGIDESFDATIFTGYHSPSGANGHPLAHTMAMSLVHMKFNDKLVSEFILNSYTSLYYGVPIVMVAGDGYICEEAKAFDENIVTVKTIEGLGGSVLSKNPDENLNILHENARIAIKNFKEVKQFEQNPSSITTSKESERLEKLKLNQKLPEHFDTELYFRQHTRAYRASFYPGAKQISAHAIRFETDDYYEFLRYFLFVFT